MWYLTVAWAQQQRQMVKSKVGEKLDCLLEMNWSLIWFQVSTYCEIFDNVYPEVEQLSTTMLQTTLIPAGGSAITEFKSRCTG